MPETWQNATKRQKSRAARSFVELGKHAVPAYQGPLLVDDDDEAKMQDAHEVARRAMSLWAVILRAEKIPQADVFKILEGLGLWGSVSPKEQIFLQSDNPDPEVCKRFAWRLECIWVFLWALGYIEKLNWPDRMCDVPKIAAIMEPLEANPDFIVSAQLRSNSELLDAQDLIMRIHWAVREALLRHGGVIPEDLDWSGHSDMLPVTMSAAVGVVEERHYALNWLLGYSDPLDWDHVDTPT